MTAQASPHAPTASAARLQRKEGRVQRCARVRQAAAVEAALVLGQRRVPAPLGLQGAALRVAAQPDAASELTNKWHS